MKVIIDLQDPVIQKQIEDGIQAKLLEITDDRLNAVVERFLKIRTARLTEDRIETLCREVIDAQVQQALGRAMIGVRSGFSACVTAAAETIVRELAKENPNEIRACFTCAAENVLSTKLR